MKNPTPPQEVFKPISDDLQRKSVQIERYVKTYQSKQSNALISMMGSNTLVADEKGATVFSKGKAGSFVITNLDLYQKGSPQSAKLLFIMLHQQYTSGYFSEVDNTVEVTLGLKEYMRNRGLKDRKSATQALWRDIEYLLNIKVKYADVTEVGVAVLIPKVGIRIKKPLTIFARFSKEWVDAIKQQFYYLPKDLHKINISETKYAVDFALKLYAHHRFNLGSPRENIISIKSLLNASSFTIDSNGKAKRYEQQVRKPFENNMNALNDMIEWEYCGKVKRIVDTPDTIEEFLNTYILFRIKDFPEELYEDLRKKKAKAYKKKPDPKKYQ